jgi:hypothetical protein
MTGRVVHVEVPYDDQDRAQEDIDAVLATAYFRDSEGNLTRPWQSA